MNVVVKIICMTKKMADLLIDNEGNNNFSLPNWLILIPYEPRLLNPKVNPKSRCLWATNFFVVVFYKAVNVGQWDDWKIRFYDSHFSQKNFIRTEITALWTSICSFLVANIRLLRSAMNCQGKTTCYSKTTGGCPQNF